MADNFDNPEVWHRMDFAPPAMELAPPPPGTHDWWRAVETGDAAEVRRLLNQSFALEGVGQLSLELQGDKLRKGRPDALGGERAASRLATVRNFNVFDTR